MRGKAIETVEDYIEREHFTDQLHPTSVICPVNVFTNAMSRRWMSVADRYNYTVPDFACLAVDIYGDWRGPTLSNAGRRSSISAAVHHLSSASGGAFQFPLRGAEDDPSSIDP